VIRRAPAGRDLRHDLRLLTSPFRVLPDFIVPGEAKCGTTSLYRYLLRHPDVYAADLKEPNNFIRHPDSRLYCAAHYPLRMTRWWHLRVRRRAFATGEASAEYLSKPGLAQRVARMLPEARVVVLLRDPVARAWSDYQMFSARGLETRAFEELVERSLRWLSDPDLAPLVDAARHLERSPLRYVLRGMYAESLRPWLEHFPAGRVLVIRSEDLYADPGVVLPRVLAHLDLPAADLGPFEVFKKGEYRDAPAEQTAERLREFYEPGNRALYALLGQDLRWGGALGGARAG
jgi:hypothetical protein